MRSERADAARNRDKILSSARRLFERHGVANVRVEDVAREAGVGKATVFRRFGDRAGLAVALLDDEDRELQEQIRRGPPPLGPGAPANERLLAFFDAYLSQLERFGDWIFDSETAKPGARYAIGSYHAWHQHVALLIAEARPEADASVLAHLVLAPLAADLTRHLRAEGRVSLVRYREALRDLIERVCA
jgi:AcrR family transcriptional regulator